MPAVATRRIEGKNFILALAIYFSSKGGEESLKDLGA
jgi:hypothetical protein